MRVVATTAAIQRGPFHINTPRTNTNEQTAAKRSGGGNFMPLPIAVPIIAGAIGAAGAIKAGIDANNAAARADEFNREAERLQKAYRLEVMNYGNTTFANDVEFFQKQIEWEKEEFARNKTQTQATMKAVNKNFYAALATQVLKMAESDMAEALGRADVRSQVRHETGVVDARAADSGVGGNVTEMLRGDVARQGGNALTIIGMNAEAERRQANLESQSLKAQRDTSLSQLTIPTFQPLQAPAPPSPVSPVNPSAPNSRMGAGTIALNAINTGINLAMGINSLRGSA